MEMIMRTISSAPAAPHAIAGQSWARELLAVLKYWWVAYMTWRIQQAAIAELWSMSERVRARGNAGYTSALRPCPGCR
jgi:hypothetical protein